MGALLASSVMLIPKYSPHEATKEKLSYLLFGFDCRFSTEAAFLPVEIHDYTDVRDYREEVVLSLASAQEFSVSNIKKAQEQYKQQYDCHAASVDYNISDFHMKKVEEIKIFRPMAYTIYTGLFNAMILI